jgi:hypothetical protein
MGFRSFFSSLFSTAPVSVSYASCQDDELVALSGHPEELTPTAREALFAELEKRGLEPAAPEEAPEEPERTPFLKRDVREAGKCGCGSGSGGCHSSGASGPGPVSSLLPLGLGLGLLLAAGAVSCRAGTPTQPRLPKAPVAGATTTFHAVADLPLAGDTVVAVRWSSILFENRGAPAKAFGARPVYEVLTHRAAGDGFSFDLPAPATEFHVFAGLCAGMGEETCTEPRWKATEAEPRYALGVLVLIPRAAKACTYGALEAESEGAACAAARPLAVSRFLLLYVYQAFSPAEDPFMSSKWPWKLPATLTPGFHVIEFTSKADAREVTPDRLEFTAGADIPNLF